jgi:SsrA-binding protein
MRSAAADITKVIATNRKAGHDYLIHEKLEAGIQLVGSEVKSLRGAHVVIADGWVEVRRGQAFLHGVTINEYSQSNRWNHDIVRVRRLLLHKHEISKLETKTKIKGYTLIPLALYFKGHRVKVELGLVTNKKQHDKRATKKEADDKREMARMIKRAR